MNKVYIVLLIAAFITGLIACEPDSDNPTSTYNPTVLTIETPSNLPIMKIPEDNPTTVEGVYLGRRLFYDKLLHPNQEKSCSSCHNQSAGFTTQGTNVVPHINLGYSDKFLWDGRKQGTLEEVMQFEVEEFFQTDISKLQNDSIYPTLFHAAFGSDIISTANCAKALAQFERTMISGNSKFDRFIRNEIVLTLDEMQGFVIFNSEKGDCFHCHSLSLMTDGDLHNNGLNDVFVGDDEGYYATSNNPADLGKFKSPSLRNCGIRTSFMHDGRFTTLDEVIEHYNSQVKLSPSLDPILTKPGKEFGLQLTPLEKQYLKAFLNTLTDTTYLTNPDFSDPF